MPAAGMPMKAPARSKAAPPLMPELRAASVCSQLSPSWETRDDRMPVETVGSVEQPREARSAATGKASPGGSMAAPYRVTIP